MRKIVIAQNDSGIIQVEEEGNSGTLQELDLDAINDDDERLMFALADFLGFEPSILLNLDWDAIDFRAMDLL